MPNKQAALKLRICYFDFFYILFMLILIAVFILRRLVRQYKQKVAIMSRCFLVKIKSSV